MLVIYAQELKKKHQLKSNTTHCFVSIFYAFPAVLFDKKLTAHSSQPLILLMTRCAITSNLTINSPQ